MNDVVISGGDLSIEDIAAVARGATVRLSEDEAVRSRIEASRLAVADAIERGEEIYGVSTLFGGMADRYIGPELLADVQKIALWQHKSTTGPRVAHEDVRAAMALRANSLMKGVSGVRFEIIERYAAFLNADAVPHVFQRGSIGASGDLVPLTYIGASVIGLDPAFLVDLEGEAMPCTDVLAKLGYEPLELLPKEGLALNNGTGACTGIASNAMDRGLDLAALTLGVQALCAQALLATNQSYAPFIHAMKPHAGQVWVASAMDDLTRGSALIRDEAAGKRGHRKGKLIQDRYSLRCLPQFLGPCIDALRVAAGQIEIEASCANDNPLIDPETGEIFHTGNFLAQYTGIAMDQLRFHIGMMAKHLDAQLAILVTPEFNYGLAPSLVGNSDNPINIGLKSLQVTTSSLMPLLLHLGQPIVDRFPTHAEQFNQNVNSQAMNAANLARESLDNFTHFLAVALFSAVQAVELRAKLTADSYDARELLSPGTQALYEAARTAAKEAPRADQPVHWDDFDEFIQPKIEGVIAAMDAGGPILAALGDVRPGIRRS
jgi:phenylalanine ammonia-lyase